ncbi:uncharacterized protein EDB91DRAFT_427382 [Suillus paluster]|uniref:uncharacterized protein n=1 Tax=Suillus paluster TaxID=48578 RepID=UPI001B862711|nr:uncharacterized protein EDB91DRAFT_427382 [Suillus paluster]KAG1753949.1 hypothetical protein EDB91DRAFT_427382 [Suillus paluster]
MECMSTGRDPSRSRLELDCRSSGRVLLIVRALPRCIAWSLTVKIASRACSRKCGCGGCLTCAPMGAILVDALRAANHPFHGSPYLAGVCLGGPGFCIPGLCIPCLCIPCLCIPCPYILCPCVPRPGSSLCGLYSCSLCPCFHDSSHRGACTRGRSDSSGTSSSCYYKKI